MSSIQSDGQFIAPDRRGIKSAFEERRRLKLPVKWIAGILLVIIVGVWLLTRHSSAPPPAAPQADAPLELAPADVANVELRALSRALPLSGSLMPVVQTTIKAQIAGELLEVNVREGQAVSKGDVLARIDDRNLAAQRDAAKASLEKAKADLAISKLNRDNGVLLLKEHFISQNAMDSLDSTLAANLALSRAAEANLRLAQLSVDYATVRAPFDGVISQRLVQPGEKVSSDVSLLTVVDLSQMELDAPAPTSEIPAVRVGQTSRFSVDGFPGRSFEAKVWRINPVTDQGSRSITIYLTVPNTDHVLRGGMFAQGELQLDQGVQRPSIPQAAVHSDAGVNYVWVVAEGLVQRREVQLGVRSQNDGLVEVTEGLKPGEQVIVAKIEAMKAGTKVSLVSTKAVPPPATSVAPKS